MAKRISGYTELIGLIAAPVRHSKSPRMHNEAFAKLRFDYTYPALEAGNEELEDTMRGFKTLKACGYNVSMPNKTVIGQYLGYLSPAAELCGAVSTVVNDNEILTGHITDDIGYMRSLRDAGIEPASEKITIAGAGGAVTTIKVQVALNGVREISISNRRNEFWERAEQNMKNINEKTSCKATLFDPTDVEAFRREVEDSYLLANATGVGMRPLEGQMVIPDASFLRKDLVVTDVVYMPAETELLHVAEGAGYKTMDGLGMVLYQGAATLELRTGREIPIDYMKGILDIKF